MGGLRGGEVGWGGGLVGVLVGGGVEFGCFVRKWL